MKQNIIKCTGPHTPYGAAQSELLQILTKLISARNLVEFRIEINLTPRLHTTVVPIHSANVHFLLRG